MKILPRIWIPLPRGPRAPGPRDPEEPECLFLECETCAEEFDILVFSVENIDQAIEDSGHEGHHFELSDYEPEEER